MSIFADKKVQVLQAPVVFCTLITMWPAMLAGSVIVCIVRCPFATVWCLLTQWQEVVSFWRAGRKRRFACIITDGAASKQGAGEEHTRRAYGVSVRSWCSDTANSVRESESWLLSSAHLSVFSFMISLWARKTRSRPTRGVFTSYCCKNPNKVSTSIQWLIELTNTKNNIVIRSILNLCLNSKLAFILDVTRQFSSATNLLMLSHVVTCEWGSRAQPGFILLQ